MDILNRRNAIKASALLSAGAFASRALMPVAAAADQTPAAPSGAPPVAMATHYGPASATGSVAEVYQKARQTSIQYAVSVHNAMELHAPENFRA